MERSAKNRQITAALSLLDVSPLPAATDVKFVLVACEKSGTVARAFSRLPGVYAMSCDIQPAYPTWNGPHYHGDVFDVLYAGWDMMIAHPPCTYMSNSGAWCLHRPDLFPGRWAQLYDAAVFFWDLLNAPIPLVVAENPVMVRYAKWVIGEDQSCSFQPYEHGVPESKRTCLWLRNLPPLVPSNVLPKPASGHWDNQTPSGQNKLGPSADRGDLRSDFHPEVADAMAAQWGPILMASL